MSGPIDTVEARGWPLPFPPRVVAGSLYSLVVVALAALPAWPISRCGALLLLVAVPALAATGIEHVLVSGIPVWQHGQGNGARPGQVLLRRGFGAQR